MPKSKARKKVDENFKVAAVQRLQTGGVLANDLAKELGVSIGHCAGGRDNIVREQRQKRAQQANPPCLQPHLKSCRLSRQSTTSRAASRRPRINRRDRTDRIGDVVLGQAAAGS